MKLSDIYKTQPMGTKIQRKFTFEDGSTRVIHRAVILQEKDEHFWMTMIDEPGQAVQGIPVSNVNKYDNWEVV